MGNLGVDFEVKRYLGLDENSDLPVSINDWKEEARKKMSQEAWSYLEGSAGSESTERENETSMERYRIRPRYLRNVENCDLSSDFLGKKHKFPVALAPIGVTSIINEEAEIAIARAARNTGIPFSLSTVSSKSIEEVAIAVPDGERWFQLYPGKNKEVMKSFIKRAEKSGYSALIVTVDTTMLGWRERDLKLSYLPFLKGYGLANFFSDPEFLNLLERKPSEDMSAAIMKFSDIYVNPSFSWDDLKEIISITKLPVILKGVTHIDDVNQAFSMGVKAVVVSNHGGRQVDGAIASIDALYEIWKNGDVKGELMFDSGIRHASHIVKAITMGASAVLVGRPYCYGLAVAGQRGVETYMNQLLSELNLQVALAGSSCIQDLRNGEIYLRY
ncbi:alpha-hydroxy-acid oxidizing protein [Cuniculiplasma sp. SKW3]|uniref:alpha-hydroxy-acid oxidizing protein n=1 Tax=unclassified Cuniculiplasma TaxID=2619706 RepID=UPI003FD33A0E